MKVLVLGAAGFIGSRITRELLSRNHSVHIPHPAAPERAMTGMETSSTPPHCRPCIPSGWAAKSAQPESKFPLSFMGFIAGSFDVDSSSARREFGYDPGPVGPAVERAVRWFMENGYF
ncbi:MAG: NAD-dependent epimerase/dehydratase family protein [Halobacteria archaeon]